MSTSPAAGTTSGQGTNPTAAQSPTRSITAVTLATAVVTTLCLLWAYYVNTPWKHQAGDWGIDTEQGSTGLLWIAGFVALGVGVVYGVVVRRALTRDPARTARTALILALVAVPLAVVAFWTGLPIILGSAAAFLGIDARNRLGRTPPLAAVAIGLGLLVAAIAVFFCVTG